MDFTKHRKKNKKKGRIHPNGSDQESIMYQNDGYEMDSIEEEKKNNMDPQASNKFKSVARKSVKEHNAMNMIANIKAGATRWRKYATSRRKTQNTCSRESVYTGGVDRKQTGGIGLDLELSATDSTDGAGGSTKHQMRVAHNRNLIEYFARLGKSKDVNECINLEYVESLLKNGASIDCTDKYGQTVFHEIARAWHVDVAKFMIDHGAKINQGDNYGRTMLHVAAAVDYAEMVDFLVKHGADKECRTNGEQQTPMHFAARNDACLSLNVLIKAGAEYKDVRDYKGRTPLHLAAELDRSETARALLELDDPAPAGVEDDSGQAAIVWMITKMPPVAKLALDQFHTTDRANRKQYFHLHRIAPRKPNDDRPVYPQSPLQVVVRFHRFDLITHFACKQLITLMWHKFGRLGAVINILLNLLFILLWTVQGIAVEYDKRHTYILPEQWWRIVIFVFALLLTIWQVKDELMEYHNSKKSHNQWKAWREEELERDIKFAHPRWPEEEQYLKSEMDELDKIRPQYFNDFWNIYDWFCYSFLLVCIITHIVDILQHTNFIARLHIRIMAVTIILIWLRLMKNARAFSLLGPFIVMLGHMISDVLKVGFLYLEFFIPYACACWMLFGESKVPEEFQGHPNSQNNTIIVQGMGTPNALIFTMFRMTLVDDYDYAGMKSVDSIMADILVGTWLALSAILMLNLFIALLSDTFQRVYDNANANSIMQKAITILSIEEGMSKKRREKFRTYIHTSCAPEENFYDDDTTIDGGQDLKKVAFQIKDQMDDLLEMLTEKKQQEKESDNLDSSGGSKWSMFRKSTLSKKDDMDASPESGDSTGHANLPLDDGSKQKFASSRKSIPTESELRNMDLVSVEKLETEVDGLREDIQQISDRQEDMMARFKRDMTAIKTVLSQLAADRLPAAGNTMDMGTMALAHYPAATITSGFPPTYSTMRSQASVMRPGTAPLVHPSTLVQQNTIHDDEWERSERQRLQDLQELRTRLNQQHSHGASVSHPPIPPPNTMDPSGDAGSEVSEDHPDANVRQGAVNLGPSETGQSYS